MSIIRDFFNPADESSIRRLFVAFLVAAVALFLTLTLLLLVPKIHSTFDTLQSESDKATTYAFASKLHRYLEDRELALMDIADSPFMTNAVLLAEGTRPDFRDFVNHALLLGEDPELTVLNVRGQKLYSENESNIDYQWALSLLDGNTGTISNLIDDETSPQFEMAVPILYGRGREGVLIARFDARPSAIFDTERELNSESAVSYSKNGISIFSDASNVKLPYRYSDKIDDYDIEVTHITSRTRIVAQKNDLIKGYITSVIIGGTIAFALLYILGRRIIVSPYVKLAATQEAISKAVEGIAQIDPNGRYTTLNTSYAEAIGYVPDDLVGKNWAITVNPEDLPMLNDAYQTMLKDGQVTAEARGIKKDGSGMYKQVTMISQYNNQGDFIGHHCFMKDITDRKKAEIEREKLVDRLLDSNEELERFAFVCSHDLQEPLRMITSFSEKLQTHMGNSLDNDPKGQKYFKFVTDGAERAQILIAAILEYSSLDRDAKTLENVPLNAIVEQVQTAMNPTMEDGKGVITSDDLPTVSGNKTQLYQLIQNLVNNGLKYQDKGADPKVHIGVEDSGELWTISVNDNGIGIDERHVSKIFDVFQRLHRRTEYAGTGVGLSICKKIAERHGGRIWVESKKGLGSTFYFTILKSKTEELPYVELSQAC